MGIWQDRLTAIADGSLTLPSVTRRLGLGRLSNWGTGFVKKEWSVDPDFCTGDGTAHQALFGGYVAALADQVLTFTAMTVMDDDHSFRTSSLQISFFRPICKGVLRIEGHVINSSRSLLHVEADFFLDDRKLAAKASAVLTLMPMKPDIAAEVQKR
jgi:acyl-coenzyme A thioesterase PaaI-like protein